MTWLLRRLGGAIVAGVGWKVGSDAYEAVKKRVNEMRGTGDEEQGEDREAEEGGAATSGREKSVQPESVRAGQRN